MEDQVFGLLFFTFLLRRCIPLLAMTSFFSRSASASFLFLRLPDSAGEASCCLGERCIPSLFFPFVASARGCPSKKRTSGFLSRERMDLLPSLFFSSAGHPLLFFLSLSSQIGRRLFPPPHTDAAPFLLFFLPDSKRPLLSFFFCDGEGGPLFASWEATYSFYLSRVLT